LGNGEWAFEEKGEGDEEVFESLASAGEIEGMGFGDWSW